MKFFDNRQKKQNLHAIGPAQDHFAFDQVVDLEDLVIQFSVRLHNFSNEWEQICSIFADFDSRSAPIDEF